MPELDPNELIEGRLLARNTIFNLAGQVTPLAVAFVSIPILIHTLGTDRYGILTLSWVVLGYFSLFDLGLSWILAKFVADRLGMRRIQEIPAIFWTTLFMLFLLGSVGTVALSLLTPLLVHDILKIPDALEPESVYAFYLLALGIPVVISTDGFRGFLEAHQRFSLTAAIRIPSVAFNYIGPLLVLPFSHSLVAVVAVLMVSRLLTFLIHLFFCLRVRPELRQRISLPQWGVLKPLLRLGGWLTVTNLISPLMDYVDRFLIGTLISVTAVAYYATPYEMVTKLWLVPTALVGVLFPAFATSSVQDRSRTALLFDQGAKYIFVILFPAVLLIVTWANEGLEYWLGAEFAQNSTQVLQLLAVGVLVNSIAQAPFGLVQALGRPDLTAKLHFVELPVYLLALWWLVETLGIEGAAIAWLGRVTVDGLVLFIMVRRFLPDSTIVVRRVRGTYLLVGLGITTLGIAALPMYIAVKALFLTLALPAFVLGTWFFILSPADRTTVRKHVTRGALRNRGQ